MSVRRNYVDPYLTVEELWVGYQQGRVWLDDIPEYKAWYDLMRRCYNRNHVQYKDYGGRGIRVYEPWSKDFWKFFRFMGRRPVLPGFRMSIDREDNNKGYFPWNCRWATQSEQNFNRRPELTNGEGHHLAKLTLKQVRFIRERCQEFTDEQLAEMFDVTPDTINNVVRNRKYHDPNWAPPDRRWHGGASIKPHQASWAKYLLAKGYDPSVIAYRMGIPTTVVWHIKTHGTWPWVEPSAEGLPDWPKTNFKRRV